MTTILLSSLGVKPRDKWYPKTEYRLGSQSVTSNLACRALANMLDQPPDTLVMVLSGESRQQHEEYLTEWCAQDGLKLHILDISECADERQIWDAFGSLVDFFSTFEEKVDVVLDITNGFRHLPLLFFSAVAFLSSFEKVRLVGLYYGAFDRSQSQGYAPFFNLSPLFHFTQGTYSAKALRERGTFGELGAFLAQWPDVQAKTARFFGRLTNLSALFENGILLEGGIEAADILNSFRQHSEQLQDFFAINRILQPITERLAQIATPPEIKGKSKLALDEDELRRQLRVASWLFDCGDLSHVLIILREWIISRIAFARQISNWYETKNRGPIERELGRLTKGKHTAQPPSKEVAALITHWDSLTQERNKFAHAGHQSQTVDLTTSREHIEEVLSFCSENNAVEATWQLPKPPVTKGQLLVTPLGNSVGLLFSAFKSMTPQKVIVVTSEAMQSRVEEIRSMVDTIPSESVRIIILKEPHTGFHETGKIAEHILHDAGRFEDVVLNLTGGTTCMQFAIQRAGELLTEHGIGYRRIAFVDRRPTAEQQAEPFVLGEMVEIDSREPKDNQ